MFIQLLAISTIWIGIALIGRWLIDTHGKDNELLRKLVHVLHGSGLAALAFVLPLILIVGIEIVFLVSVIIARYLTGHFTKVPWISYMNRMYSV